MQYTYKRLSIFAAVALAVLTTSAVVLVTQASARTKIEPVFTVYSLPVGEVPVMASQLALAEDALSTLTARSVYVQDLTTQAVLFQKNAQRILLPASTTKLMTALVVMESQDLDDSVTIVPVAGVNLSPSLLRIGGVYTVYDLLHALLIQSSNEAAYALAASHPAGPLAFVARMNEKAQELGLESTYFENPAGFDAPRQISSARDLAVLTQVFLQEPLLKSIVALSEYSISNTATNTQLQLKTTHQLLGKDPSVIGVKTGTTQGASQVLITVFERNGRQVLVIVMGSEDRYSETANIADWAYATYQFIPYQELLARFTQTE